MPNKIKYKNLSLFQIIVLILIKRFFIFRGDLRELTSKMEIDEARRLQASTYLRRGNVDKDQVTSKGVLNQRTDPYMDISRYFGFVKKGRVIAGGRILYSKDRTKLQISGETDLSKFDSGLSICELSGVVKKHGIGSLKVPALSLFILEYCFHNYDLVVSAVTEQPYKKFRNFAGPFAKDFSKPFIIQHGNNLVYPVVMEVGKITKNQINNGGLFSYVGYKMLTRELSK